MALWSAHSGKKDRMEAEAKCKEIMSEFVPDGIVVAFSFLTKQADSQKNQVRLSSEEDVYEETFGKLSDDEKIALERLFDLQGRTINFFSSGLIVHPTRYIEKGLAETHGQLYHVNCRRTPRARSV